jgi:hypothetical protein
MPSEAAAILHDIERHIRPVNHFVEGFRRWRRPYGTPVIIFSDHTPR